VLDTWHVDSGQKMGQTRAAACSRKRNFGQNTRLFRFSYADLAKSVGVSKASIHHHFPAKEDLGPRSSTHTKSATLPSWK